MTGTGRRAVIALGFVAAVTACTSSSSPTTTSDSSPSSTSAPSSTTTTEDPLLRLALPIDPAVVRGELENGVTYYIRENDSPGGRAELRLLVDAGSVNEGPGQAGMAHFLEHMMFNGTERFPRNELVAALESFGPRFGPDINAHTSYDETVYELSLATDDPELVQLGIDVLREWASRATLDETDVLAERGVIADEWRLRAQGFEARLNEQLDALVLDGSAYEGHDPIGTAESIQAATAETLRRFYLDWYRPERMAVVAVGDFDASAMESAINAAFGDLQSAGEPPPSPDVGYTPPAEPRVATFVDEEAASAGVSLLWATPSTPVATVGDYQRSLAISLGLGILADRLNDDASVADSPLLGASPLDLIWARGVTVRGVDGQLRATRAIDGMERLLAEVERIRREGVSAEEAQRALDGYASFSHQLFEQRESAQDTEFVTRIADHHLAGGHLMSPDQRFDVESDVLARLDEQAVEKALQDLLVEAPLILALGPDDAGLEIPSPDQLRAAWSSLATADLPPRPELPDRDGELMARPPAADIVASSVDPRFGFTSLEFENGATVYLWESDIATESVHMQAEGFGGTSVVDVPDLTEAMLMVDMAQRSGVGETNAPALRRLLADRIVSVQPWISETRQGVDGNASVEDVEWLFQLLHLTMTSPRFDEAPVDAVLDEIATLTASRADLPDVLFDEALDQAYYGDDPRYFVLPPDDELRDFDVRTAERLYEERFGDASNFAFAFVGDFETPVLSDLAARYIGTLPGSGQPGDFIDHQPLPPRAVQVATVAAGAGEQGQVGLFFTNQLEPDLDDRLTARVLELILTARLRERVREELSATYSITTGIDLQREPDAFAEAFVMSSGDPDGLDLIVAEVVSELEALQAAGPTETELSTALEQLRDELELVDNPTLAAALITAHLYPDEPVRHLVDRYERVDAVTGEAVRGLAEAVFDLEQRIEVRQIPRT